MLLAHLIALLCPSPQLPCGRSSLLVTFAVIVCRRLAMYMPQPGTERGGGLGGKRQAVAGQPARLGGEQHRPTWDPRGRHRVRQRRPGYLPAPAERGVRILRAAHDGGVPRLDSPERAQGPEGLMAG